MFVPKSNFLYSVYGLVQISRLVNFFLPSKNFLLHSIVIEQTVHKVLIIIIKYFFIKSFFRSETVGSYKNLLQQREKLDFEHIFVKSLLDVSSKSVIVSFFNLKKIYANKILKVRHLLDNSNLKKSVFNHSISNYILTVLVFSIGNAQLLSAYINLEIRSTRNHNAFILFLKSMLYFVVTIIRYKKYSKPIGFRILVAGRFNGQSRSKIKQLRVGSLGLQSVKNRIDFHKCCCLTKFGTFGIKVWINNS
jgi:hypothetical protein